MQVDLDERSAILLEKLRTQAGAQLLPLSAYLEQFVQADQHPSAEDILSLAEFDRVLDEIVGEAGGAPSLGADFSRADIYTDHD